MDPTKSNEDDSLKNLDAEEAKLREEASNIDPVRTEDASIEDDSTEGEQAAPSADDTAKKKTEADKKAAADKAAADKAAADKASKENAEKSAADKAAADKAAAEKNAAEEKNLSSYEKTRIRLNRSWKEHSADKEALRKEREAFNAERKKFEEDRTKAAATKPKPEKSKHNGFTAEDYKAAAADFRAEGKKEDAERAEKVAKELEEKDAKLAKEAGGESQPTGEFVTLPTGSRITSDEKQKMEAEWTENLKRLGEQNPELQQADSPLRTEVVALLGKDEKGNLLHPILHSHASGIHYAVQVAKLKVAAAQVPTLTARITELEAENKRLTSLTSLDTSGGGGEGRRDKPAPGNSGNLEQDEKALRDEAMAADARGGG